MKKFMVCILAGLFLTGCGIAEGETYTREEPENLARLELYEAGSDELLKTIEDEETLHQYIEVTVETLHQYIEEAAAFNYEYGAEGEEDLKEAAENAGATCYLVAYQYPAAKFGSKEPEKVYTITVYRDVKIAKLTGAEESVKNIALPEELLTFYYEMSEEEKNFYESLLP